MIFNFPREFQMTTLAVILMVLRPSFALARDTSSHFVFLRKSECHFSKGTERVRFLERQYYNGEEHVRFDSDLGKYLVVTELGRLDAVYWNSRKDILERKMAAVDMVCKHNYGIIESFTVQRKGAHSDSAQNKMLSGIGGFVLGLVFLGVGPFINYRNQKELPLTG